MELELLLLMKIICLSSFFLPVKSSPLDIFIQPLDYIEDKAISSSVMETVQLHCRARGHNITYKWLQDSKLVQIGKRVQIINGSLLITNVETSDRGRYQCIALGKEGISVSRFATLEILTLPWMLSRSDPAIVREGNYSRLACGIVTKTKPWPSIIYWTRKSTGQNPVDGNRIFVSATTGNLYFSYVTKLDTDEYRCHVVSEVFHQYLNLSLKQESQSTWKILKVIGESNGNTFAATILSEDEQTIQKIEGTNRVILDCIAVGRPLPLIYWDRSDGPLPFDRYNYENNGRRLVLKSVTAEDSDRYQCHARNSNGQVETIFDLAVERRPQWINAIHEVFVPVLQSIFRWPCAASGYNISYLWFVNGNEIKNNSKFEVLLNGDLVISSVTKNDSKMFTCIAMNNFDNIASYGRLNVISSPPKFLSSKSSQILFMHNTDVLHCAVSGGPKPDLQYSYYKDGKYVNITNTNTTKYKECLNGDLNLYDIVQSDEGVYRCRAVNIYGESSKVINVFVRNQTIITTNSSKKILVRRHHSFVLMCSVTKDARLNMRLVWQKDKVHLRNCSNISILYITPTISLLIVSNATFAFTGVYSCTVTLYDRDQSLNRQVKNETRLIVGDVPDPVHNLTYHELTTNSVFISWVPGSENFRPITRFIVFYQVNDQAFFKIANRNISPNTNTAKLTLAPWNKYQITVKAENSIGTSKYGQVMELQTEGSSPIYMPANIRASGSKSMPDVIRVYWTPLAREFHCGPGIQYFLLYKEWKNHSQKYTKIKLLNHHQTMVHNLIADIYYEIRMQIKNNFGEGNMSAPIFVKTGLAPPDLAPDKLEIFQINETSVQIFWRKIATSLIISGYKVAYNDSNTMNIVSVGDVSSAVIAGLMGNHVYTFNVYAYNDGGDGLQSETVHMAMAGVIYGSTDATYKTCRNHPCYHGSCVLQRNGYRCACFPGWLGKFCDLDISLQPKPYLFPLMVKSGEIASFTCIIKNITSDSGITMMPIKYTWYLDGVLLADSKAMIISQGYTSILTLAGNFTTENHKLSCTASNSAGKGSASTMLTVLSESDVMCPSERKHGIQWFQTKATQTDYRLCPKNYVGIARRTCKLQNEGAVWDDPNLAECMTNQLYYIKSTILSGSYDCDYMLHQLVLISSSANNLIIGDLIVIISSLSAISRDCYRSVTNKILQNYALVVNNVLNLTLQHQWHNIQETTNTSVLDVVAVFKDIATRWRDTSSNYIVIKHPNLEIEGRVLSADYNVSDMFFQRAGDNSTTVSFPEELLKPMNQSSPGCFAVIRYMTLQDLITISKSDTILSRPKRIKEFSLASPVISVGIRDLKDKPTKFPVKVEFRYRRRESISVSMVKEEFRCISWNIHLRNGVWLDSGCEAVFNNLTAIICRCKYLTAIALLSVTASEDNSSRISAETTNFIYMSSGIALVCCTLTVGHFCYLISIYGYSSRYFSIINLAGVFGIANLFVMIVESVAKDLTKQAKIDCSIIGAALYYFVISSFMWSAVKTRKALGVHLGFRKRSYKIAWALFYGYGLPAIPTIVLVAVQSSNIVNSCCHCLNRDYIVYLLIIPISSISAVNVGVLIHSFIHFKNVIEQSHKNMKLTYRLAAGSEMVLICLLYTCWITRSIVCIHYNLYVDTINNALVAILGLVILAWFCIVMGRGLYLPDMLLDDDRIALMNTQDNSACTREWMMTIGLSVPTDTISSPPKSLVINSIKAPDKDKTLDSDYINPGKSDAVSVTVQTSEVPEFPTLDK